MQSRVELLPPSHFMRPPPSSFQPQQKNLTTKLVNVHMPKCTADDSRTSVPAAPSAALSPFAGESSSVPQSEGIASSNASVSLQPSLHPSSTRTQTVTKAYVKPATRRADDSAATETRHRRNETFSTACKEYQGRECPLQCSEHSSGREHGKILDDWLPRKHSGAVGSRQSAANYQQNWRTQHRFPARDTTGKVDCITTSNAHETKDYENASVKLEENAEEVLARSLARCQKIDKSLEFYADIRKRWSGPSGDQSRHKTTSNASQPAAATSSRATPHAKIGAHAQKARQSRLGLRTDRGERKTKNYKPPSVFKDGVKSDFYQKRGSENSDTVKRLGERERSRVDSQQTVRKAYGPHLNDLNSLYPERRKKESGYKSPSSSVALNSSVSASKESVPVNATPTISAETESKVSGERPTAPPSRPLHTKTNPHATKLSITLPSQPVQSEQHQQYTEQSELKESEQVRVKETEEEFNDFDSVQPDSDSEPVELLSGTFGKPVLTGARPITSPEVVATRDSSQPVIGVCKKELTSTHNDTVLARVLQAEEESRAGVCLQRKLPLNIRTCICTIQCRDYDVLCAYICT